MIKVQRIAVTVLVATGIWGTALWLHDLQTLQKQPQAKQAMATINAANRSINQQPQ